MRYNPLGTDEVRQYVLDTYVLRHARGAWYVAGRDHRTEHVPLFNLSRVARLRDTYEGLRPGQALGLSGQPAVAAGFCGQSADIPRSARRPPAAARHRPALRCPAPGRLRRSGIRLRRQGPPPDQTLLVPRLPRQTRRRLLGQPAAVAGCRRGVAAYWLTPRIVRLTFFRFLRGVSPAAAVFARGVRCLGRFSPIVSDPFASQRFVGYNLLRGKPCRTTGLCIGLVSMGEAGLLFWQVPERGA
jgi:hypothetical protein